MLIDVIDGSHDAFLEFLFGCDADVAKNGAGEFGKETLDQVEPGAVRGRECELEAASSLGGEPSFRLLGDVSGMIVKDQLDRGIGRIGSVENFQKFDELAAAMAIFDLGMDFAGEEINARQEAERAVALVLIIASETRLRLNAGLGGKSGAVVASAWMPGFSS